MEKYTVDINDDYRKLIKAQITATYNQLNKDKDEIKVSLEKQLEEVEKKIERLEERYILEEIDKAMFDKFKSKFIAERSEIYRSLAKNVKKVSNLELLIDNAITMASKLASLWDSSDYADKQTLQKLVFPEGLSYCRKTNECRTQRINSIFHYIADMPGISDKIKAGTLLFRVMSPLLWRIPESNPRPNTCQVSFLHVYSCII